MAVKTYITKLGCRNCGVADWYHLPYASTFLYVQLADDDDYAYRPSGYRDVHGIEHELKCKNCGTPRLTGVEFDSAEIPQPSLPEMFQPQWVATTGVVTTTLTDQPLTYVTGNNIMLSPAPITNAISNSVIQPAKKKKIDNE